MRDAGPGDDDGDGDDDVRDRRRGDVIISAIFAPSRTTRDGVDDNCDGDAGVVGSSTSDM